MTVTTVVLLSLAAWRTWALASRDTILDRVRDRFAPTGSARREFLLCPYCAGFWSATVWVAVWATVVRPGALAALVVWWAVAAGVVLVEAIDARLIE